MSEQDAELLPRLDELLKEVRRQGRAAVAAQAAAESCLTAVEALARRAERDPEPAPGDEPARWLRALLPTIDALDRAAAQATALIQRRARPRRGFLRALFRAAPDDDAEVNALLAGVEVLGAQLEAALGELGVVIDEPLGEPVDPERHRVVAVSAPRRDEPSGVVVELARPGYAIGTKVVREAEVIATAPRPQPAALRRLEEEDLG